MLEQRFKLYVPTSCANSHRYKLSSLGSYAYGTPTEDSDVDLLVVMDVPKSEFRNTAIKIRQRIPYHFGMDLLVRSPEEIAYRVSYNDWFLREITEKGEIPSRIRRALQYKKPAKHTERWQKGAGLYEPLDLGVGTES